MNLQSVPSSNLLGQKIKKAIPLDLGLKSNLANDGNWFAKLELLSNLPEVYYGGYLEKRFFYRNENLFGKGNDARVIHLGFDLWIPSGSSIHLPFKGKIHSIANNDKSLDYGHTLIIKHSLKSIPTFYSLYGHLNMYHRKFSIGTELDAGYKVCEIGSSEENGGWPPHLHVQLIKDLGDYVGDYPGVCSIQDLDFYRDNCPDPSLLFTRYV